MVGLYFLPTNLPNTETKEIKSSPNLLMGEIRTTSIWWKLQYLIVFLCACVFDRTI